MKTHRLWIVIVVLALAALACNAPGRPADDTAPTQTTPVNLATPATTAVTPTLALTVGGPTITAAATPTQFSGITPTTAPGGAQRISFATGATSATVNGNLSAAPSSRTYLIGAAATQTMTLTLTVTGGTGALGVAAPNGASLLDTSAGQTTWAGTLTASGDYTVTVALISGGPATYTLEVVIPPVGSFVQCWVTLPDNATTYNESSLNASVFSTVGGEQVLAIGRTADGWIGFEPGIARAGNQGRARLRWYPASGQTLTYEPAGCQDNLVVLLSMASLENGTYYVFDLQDVTPANGEYSVTDFDPAETGEAVQSTFMGDAYAFGDLNGDGREDAVIVLVTSTGGTGQFVEIHAILNNNGTADPAASYFVDDRGPVNALSIANGVITAEVTIHDADDPGCCPTLNETWQLRLQGGELVKIN